MQDASQPPPQVEKAHGADPALRVRTAHQLRSASSACTKKPSGPFWPWLNTVSSSSRLSDWRGGRAVELAINNRRRSTLKMTAACWNL